MPGASIGSPLLLLHRAVECLLHGLLRKECHPYVKVFGQESGGSVREADPIDVDLSLDLLEPDDTALEGGTHLVDDRGEELYRPAQICLVVHGWPLTRNNRGGVERVQPAEGFEPGRDGV